MELLLSRSQKQGLAGLGSVSFILDVRTRLTPEEQGFVSKYKFGNEILYSKQGLADKLAKSGVFKQLLSLITAKVRGHVYTVNDLVKGRTVVCKDIIEMLNAEKDIQLAAEGLSNILIACQTFGGEEVITYPRPA